MKSAWSLLCLLANFTWNLLLSNLEVARIVLSPRLHIRPGLIAYRTELKTDLAITALANIITLTPGTLTLEVSKDRTVLFIHALDIEKPEVVTDNIRGSFEKRLLELEECWSR
ncbi:MAG TPA: hypothetical protein EYG16_11660 [Deltaproteobacteria bacterium]|nr:hypothetical protein [Candidatus Binatota bacterium]HIL14315.1 hypothetical protein [Deltaproteobacteria bacterium]